LGAFTGSIILVDVPLGALILNKKPLLFVPLLDVESPTVLVILDSEESRKRNGLPPIDEKLEVVFLGSGLRD
jgi:hypothetical protein